VRRVLGLVEDERYVELLHILAEARHGDVFPFVQDLLDEGYDLVEFYHGLVDALRALLRLRLDPDARIPELADHLRDAYLRAGEAFSPADIVRMLSLASELESTGSLRRSGHPRLLVEMLLLRLTYLDRTVELEELIRGLGGAPTEDPRPRATEPAERTAPRSRPDEAGSDAEAGDPGPEELRAAPTDEVEAPLPDPPAAPSEVPDTASEPDAPEPPAQSNGEESPPPPSAGAGLPAVWEWAVGTVPMPSGLGTFLRAAEVEEDDESRIHVRLDAAAADRFEVASVGSELAAALGRALERSVTLVVDPVSPDGGRITQDTVKEGRLREYIAEEPLLEHAVLELDLELLD